MDELTTKVTGAHLLLAPPVGGPTWRGCFSPGTNPAALAAMFSLQVLTLVPNSLPLLFVMTETLPLPPRLSISSLALGLEQRAIWAGLAASSGRSSRRKDIVCQHLSAAIKDIPVEPFKHSQYLPRCLSLFFSPFPANKTSIQ